MKTLLFMSLTLVPLLGLARPFELQGAFRMNEERKTPVTFDLKWEEKDGEIAGFYSDNAFAQRAPVRGQVTEHGRTFEVFLPEEKLGVKSLTLLTATRGPKKTGTSVPLQMVTRDVNGNPLSTAKLTVQFIERTEDSNRKRQAQEEKSCGEDLGDLAGYCGRYGGMISEEFDSGKICDLMTAKEIRLELDNDANLIFHTAQPGDKHKSQDHLIGRVPSYTPSRTVDIMSRHCRPLPATNFPGEDCKVVNLIGTFSMRKGEPHFQGTYTISNEKTDKSCRYSMSLDRVQKI